MYNYMPSILVYHNGQNFQLSNRFGNDTWNKYPHTYQSFMKVSTHSPEKKRNIYYVIMYTDHSMWPIDAIWHNLSFSRYVEVITCCLTTPSIYFVCVCVCVGWGGVSMHQLIGPWWHRMMHETWLMLVQVMACHQCGTKPSLNQCRLIVTWIFKKLFQSKYSNENVFQCCMQNRGHFVQASMYLSQCNPWYGAHWKRFSSFNLTTKSYHISIWYDSYI